MTPGPWATTHSVGNHISERRREGAIEHGESGLLKQRQKPSRSIGTPSGSPWSGHDAHMLVAVHVEPDPRCSCQWRRGRPQPRPAPGEPSSRHLAASGGEARARRRGRGPLHPTPWCPPAARRGDCRRKRVSSRPASGGYWRAAPSMLLPPSEQRGPWGGESCYCGKEMYKQMHM